MLSRFKWSAPGVLRIERHRWEEYRRSYQTPHVREMTAAISLTSVFSRPSATVVTYGGMSKLPLSIPSGSFIFKDLTFKGFWWSGHTSEKLGVQQKAQLLDRIADFIQQHQLSIR